ncbi:hypothetical protein ACO2Q8_10065 [Larkinella sp. VNQ87]|uniref:hypothetical protein n=1 Tax=Larkinella sp. VNQ87 TaxID=3400921 RepID=UPI003C0A4975
MSNRISSKPKGCGVCSVDGAGEWVDGRFSSTAGMLLALGFAEMEAGFFLPDFDMLGEANFLQQN